MKIRPVGAEFHADGRTDRQTDMTKLTVAFRNFANPPKKVKYTFLFKVKGQWLSLHKGEAGEGDEEGFAILRFSITLAGKTMYLLELVILIFPELHGPFVVYNFYKQV